MLLLSQLALVAALTRPSACPSALRSGCAAVPPPRLLLQQPQLAAGHCCRTAPLLHGRVAAQLRAPPVVMKSAEANEDKPGMNTNALKYLVLTLLVLQNSLTAILARASRLPSPAGSQLYLGSVAVFTAEVIKLPVCIALIARDTGGVRPMLRSIWEQVFVNWRDTLKMAVPALCYCLQNALFFVALSRLSATSYQLWSQSKTLFTAAFFVLYLGQTLRKQQWAALVLLTAGVGLVQVCPPLPTSLGPSPSYLPCLIDGWGLPRAVLRSRRRRRCRGHGRRRSWRLQHHHINRRRGCPRLLPPLWLCGARKHPSTSPRLGSPGSPPQSTEQSPTLAITNHCHHQPLPSPTLAITNPCHRVTNPCHRVTNPCHRVTDPCHRETNPFWVLMPALYLHLPPPSRLTHLLSAHASVAERLF